MGHFHFSLVHFDCSVCIKDTGSNKLAIHGCYRVTLITDQQNFTHNFIIKDLADDIICGIDFINEKGITIDSENHHIKYKQIPKLKSVTSISIKHQNDFSNHVKAEGIISSKQTLKLLPYEIKTIQASTIRMHPQLWKHKTEPNFLHCISHFSLIHCFIIFLIFFFIHCLIYLLHPSLIDYKGL